MVREWLASVPDMYDDQFNMSYSNYYLEKAKFVLCFKITKKKISS